MRLAVVAPDYGNPWHEGQLLTRRLAGTLACFVDVDLLLPGARRTVEHDGAVRVLRFPASPFDSPRREAWRLAMLGVRQPDDLLSCTCTGRRAQQARDLPPLAEKELLFSEGGYSPELYEHVRHELYDLVVFVGYHSTSSYWGIRALPDHRRLVLVPAAADDSTLWLRIHDETFERAERILVSTEVERARIVQRVGPERSEQVENVGFLLGVNTFARTTEPSDFEDGPFLVVVGNWDGGDRAEQFIPWAEELERSDLDLRLHLVGPGAERHRYGKRLTASRLDIWRWVCRAAGLVDTGRDRLLGRDVLEAMLFGTPVIVHANGGATREHAELGNGGLWYRTEAEFFATAAALLDNDIWDDLGRHGRSYAEERYADTDGFIKRIAETLLQ